MLIRLILFSDLHVTHKAVYSHLTDDGLSDYLHVLQRSFDWLCNSIIKQLSYQPNVRNVVAFLGDMAEAMDHIDSVSLNVCVKLFDQLASACSPSWGQIPIVAVVGNHDVYSSNSSIHNLEFLKLLQRRGDRSVTVVDTPCFLPKYLVYGLSHKVEGDSFIYCLPWQLSSDIVIPPEARVVLSHIDVVGGSLNSTMKSEKGIDPSTITPYLFNGHYHHPSQVNSSKCRNIGSLCSRTLHDANSLPHGITIVEVNDETGAVEIERYENPADVPIVDVELMSAEQADDTMLMLDGKYARVTYSEEAADFVDTICSSATYGYTKRLAPNKAVKPSRNVVNEQFLPEENLRMWLMADTSVPVDDIEDILEVGCEYLNRVQTNPAVEQGASPLEFVSIEATNFQPFDHIKHDFSDGLIYLEGMNESRKDSNGAGKSAFAEAIYYCLTGKLLRSAQGDDIIRWIEDSDGNLVARASHSAVECTLFVGMQLYKIGRYRKHPTHGTGSRLWVLDNSDERDISARTATATDKQIRSLIGRSDELLRHSVFLTSGLSDRFTALPYPERVKLIESITSSSINSEIFKLVDVDLKKAESTNLSTLSTLNVLKQERATYEERISKLMETLNGFSMLDCVDDLEVTNKTLTELTSYKADLELQLQEVDKTSAVDHELTTVLGDKIGRMKATISDMELEAKKAQVAITHAISVISAYDKLLEAGTCPTCGAEITDSSLPCVDRDTQLASVEAAKEIYTKASKSYNLAIAKKDLIQQQYEAAYARLKTHVAERTQLTGTLATTQTSIDGLTKERDFTRDKQLAANEQTTIITSKVEEVTSLLLQAEEAITLREEELAASEKVVGTLVTLHRAFHTTGIRSRLLSTVTIPYLNERLSEYAARGLCMPARLVSEVETKLGEVRSRIDVVLLGNRSFAQSSSGERRSVDVAIQLALNDLSLAVGEGYINLLVCDEIADPLDHTALSALVDLLRAKSAHQAIYVSDHRPYLGTLLDRSIRIRKVNGVASIS